jgi:hypothetical protein
MRSRLHCVLGSSASASTTRRIARGNDPTSPGFFQEHGMDGPKLHHSCDVGFRLAGRVRARFDTSAACNLTSSRDRPREETLLSGPVCGVFRSDPSCRFSLDAESTRNALANAKDLGTKPIRRSSTGCSGSLDVNLVLRYGRASSKVLPRRTDCGVSLSVIAIWKPDENGKFIHPFAIGLGEKVAKSWVV